MPSSSMRTFFDPQEYAAAIRAGEVEITLSKRGNFTATLIRIDLHHLWMQRFNESAARLRHVAQVTDRRIITFLSSPGPELMSHGISKPVDAIVCHAAGDDYYERSSGPCCWAGMSLPAPKMAAMGAAVVGRDLAAPAATRILIPKLALVARLRRLHATAGQIAAEAPEVIENPEAARGLEQTLIGALLGCFDGDSSEDRSALRRHSAIMRRFYQALNEDPDRALYLSELCVAVGVPERTLRACCYEHLGMGPKRYLLLRRLHLARRALARATPGTISVTTIATQFGFWQFGRFAVGYRALFGELPSTTLRRLPA